MASKPSAELRENLDGLLEKLLASSEFYDCTFKVGPEGNSRTFRVLKAQLANISDVLKAQLFGKFQESRQDRDSPILLPKCDPNVFECIVRASYGLTPIINEFNVMQLIIESKYYSIPILTQASVEWLETQLNETNALAILNNCYILGLINLSSILNTNYNPVTQNQSTEEKVNTEMETAMATTSQMKNGDINSKDNFAFLALKCLFIICQNGEKVVQSEFFWKHSHSDVIESIIGCDYFKVNEEKLWQALVKWVKYQALRIEDKDCSKSIFDATTNVAGIDELANEEKHDDTSQSRLMSPVQVSTKHLNTIKKSTSKHNDLHECDYCQRDENSISRTKEFELMQPFIKYIRFTLMSKKFFCINVKDWLLRKDLEYIFIRLCCPDDFKNSDDWINYDERKIIGQTMEQWLCGTDNNGRNYDVVKASCNMEAAQKLNQEDVQAEWSRESEQPQWFIVQLKNWDRYCWGCKLMNKKASVSVEWKNQYGDGDTIKNVEIYTCKREAVNDISQIDCESNMDSIDWHLALKWTSDQTSDRQTFDLDITAIKSPFIKFNIVDTYGGYTCLDDLQIFMTKKSQ